MASPMWTVDSPPHTRSCDERTPHVSRPAGFAPAQLREHGEVEGVEGRCDDLAGASDLEVRLGTPRGGYCLRTPAARDIAEFRVG
jgi:hypothetical protein